MVKSSHTRRDTVACIYFCPSTDSWCLAAEMQLEPGGEAETLNNGGDECLTHRESSQSAHISQKLQIENNYQINNDCN